MVFRLLRALLLLFAIVIIGNGCTYTVRTLQEEREPAPIWVPTGNAREVVTLTEYRDGLLSIRIFREVEKEEMWVHNSFPALVKERIKVDGGLYFVENFLLMKYLLPTLVSVITVPVALLVTPYELAAWPIRGKEPQSYELAYTFLPIDLTARFFGGGMRRARYHPDVVGMAGASPLIYKESYWHNVMDGFFWLMPLFPYMSQRAETLSVQRGSDPQTSRYESTGRLRFAGEHFHDAMAYDTEYAVLVDGVEATWLSGGRPGEGRIDIGEQLRTKRRGGMIDFEIREKKSWRLVFKRSYGVRTFSESTRPGT